MVQYKKAMSVDETSVTALAGIILCQLLEGHTSEAEHQLEFLAEVSQLISPAAHLLDQCEPDPQILVIGACSDF
jgi:tetratricopeptide repeat protein 21B